MRSSTALALFFTLSAASLLAVSSASANAVPTRPKSAYGGSGSFIQSPPGTSVVSSGVTIDEESFCSDSESLGDSCALSYAFQIASDIPAGTTSLTITIPVPAGAVLSTFGSSIGMGILTDDSSGISSPNLFFTAGLSQADVAALSSTAITFGLDGSGNPYITLNNPLSLADFPAGLNGLAFSLDVATDADGDPFTCPALNCTGDDIPPIPTPALGIEPSMGTAPEPGTLLSLFPALGLLGLYRRRSKS
jgi:hypothetical protein